MNTSRATIDIDVPCNGCTLCCQRDAVRLLPGDNPCEYQVAPHSFIEGELMLAHQTNGDCIYLDREHGCTIHGRRPRMCREMDCRNIARAMTWTQARKAVRKGLFRMAIWRRGKELLEQ